MWYGYDSLQDELNVKGFSVGMSELKRIMKGLKEKDIVELKHTSGYKSRVEGSGYFLTEEI